MFMLLFLNDLSNFVKISRKHSRKQCKLALFIKGPPFFPGIFVHV